MTLKIKLNIIFTLNIILKFFFPGLNNLQSFFSILKDQFFAHNLKILNLVNHNIPTFSIDSL